jgi:hypothetical protein
MDPTVRGVELGRAAVRVALQRLADPAARPFTVTVQGEIVPGATIGAPPGR